ncbi:MAG: Fe(2+)-trafficking protein [Planctomycetes bacterium]|nr:Fe(2+)-trafficking protein [Planctomycetota bacterium]
MAERRIKCARLGRELPALDEDTPAGRQALQMVLLIGGPDLQQRVREQVSAEAWKMWLDHQVMVVNEFRLDPTSDAANDVLRAHMEAFFFGEQATLPDYTPPEQT